MLNKQQALNLKIKRAETIVNKLMQKFNATQNKHFYNWAYYVSLNIDFYNMQLKNIHKN